MGIACCSTRLDPNDGVYGSVKELREENVGDFERWRHDQSLELEGAALSVAFSPDGRVLAVGDASERLSIYSAHTCELICGLEHSSDLKAEIVSIAFSPDGSTLAACSYYRMVVYASPSWTLARALDDACDYKSVVFSPKDKVVVVGIYANSLHVYDARTWKLQRVMDFASNRSELFALAFSVCGGFLAIGGDAGTLAIHDTRTWKKAKALRSGGAVAFRPRGDVMVASNYHYNHKAKHLTVYQVGKWHEILTLEHSGAVWCLAFSPKGNVLAAGDAAQKLTVYDADTWQVLCALDGQGDALATAFSPCGRMLAVGCGGPRSSCDVYVRNDQGEALQLRALAARAAEEAEAARRRAHMLAEKAERLEEAISGACSQSTADGHLASVSASTVRCGQAPDPALLSEQELFNKISQDLDMYCGSQHTPMVCQVALVEANHCLAEPCAQPCCCNVAAYDAHEQAPLQLALGTPPPRAWQPQADISPDMVSAPVALSRTVAEEDSLPFDAAMSGPRKRLLPPPEEPSCHL